jgi:serine/threonine protein kinase/Tol biopolymer transport system component
MSLATGAKLGPYEILAPLGEGGMGEVYKARDTRLDRTVAIKILKGGFSDRFMREAKTIGSLNHAHICTLHDVGPDYLVLEYVEGAPVKGPLPLPEVVRLGQQICEALEAAHRKGIVHRDLKPANILVTRSGVKLLDFGLAKGKLSLPGEQDATVTQPITQAGSILGTVPYMSPEQLQGAEADARSDIFSLGCVLYEMVTGQRPFQGKTQVSVMAAILEHDPPPIAEKQPLTPYSLDHAIRLCLAKDPDERWQSAHDVALELRNVTEQPAGGAAVQPSRRAWLWPAIAGVAVLIAAGAFWKTSQTTREVPFALRTSIPWTELMTANLSMSLDGHYLVESSGGVNRGPKWLRPLDGAEARPIPGSEDWDGQAFWSPDSRYLAFAVPGKLQKMPVAGGPTELICPLNETAQGGAWSSNGSILLRAGSQLLQVPAGGGTPAPALKEVPAGVQISPQFLPDGKQFLFYLAANDGDKTGTYLASLGGAAPRLLLPRARATYARQGSAEVLLFTQRGTWMQKFDSSSGKLAGEPLKLTDTDSSALPSSLPFAASQSGVVAWQEASPQQSELIWLDRTGRKTGTLAAPASASNPKISWQGGRVAYTAANGQEIGFSEVARGVYRTVAKSDAGALYHPLWSPDGSMIVYYGNRQILLRHADTDGNPVEVAKMDRPGYLHDWSRDGRYITYVRSNPKGGFDLMALPMNGDKAAGAPFLVFHSSERSLHTALSPDSQWVALSTNKGDTYEVFVTPFSDQTKAEGRGPRWQVSTHGGVDPKWSPQGNQIYFLSRDFKKLLVAEFKPGSPPTTSAPRDMFDWNFTWYLTVRNSYSVDPATGRFLVVNRLNPTYAPITVLSNWAALLNKH